MSKTEEATIEEQKEIADKVESLLAEIENLKAELESWEAIFVVIAEKKVLFEEFSKEIINDVPSRAFFQKKVLQEVRGFKQCEEALQCKLKLLKERRRMLALKISELDKTARIPMSLIEDKFAGPMADLLKKLSEAEPEEVSLQETGT